MTDDLVELPFLVLLVFQVFEYPGIGQEVLVFLILDRASELDMLRVAL